MKTKRARELRQIVERAGYVCAQIEQRNAGHLRVLIQNTAGETRAITASMTPSDNKRANRNFLSDIKRVWTL